MGAVGGLLGISLYGIVVMVITLVALFTRGWTKATIILLLIAWIPFILFLALMLLAFASLTGIRDAVFGTLFLAAPIVVILGGFALIWYVMNRIRG